MKAGRKPTFFVRLQSGVDWLGRKAVFWLALVIFAFVAVNSFLRTTLYEDVTLTEIVHYRWDNPFINLLWLAAALAVAGICVRFHVWEKLSLRRFEGLVALWVLAAGVFWVLLVRTAPMWEAGRVSTIAMQFLHGDFSDLGGDYLRTFPFQLGYIAYVELVYTLFGSGNYVAVQLLNVGFLVVAYHALSRITWLMFGDDRVSFFLNLLLLGCWWPLQYAHFVYGILPGMALALLAVWAALAYLKGGKTWVLVACIACATLAVQLKSNYLVFVIGIFIVLLVDGVRQKRKALLVGLPLLVLCAFLGSWPVGRLYEARSGGQYTVDAGVPMSAYIAMGLQTGSEMAPGWFNGYSYAVYPDSGYDADRAGAVIWDSIGESLGRMGEDPAGAVAFFYEKAASQWNEPTTGSLSVAWNMSDFKEQLSALALSVFQGRLYKLILGCMDGFHLVVYAFGAVGLWLRRKKWTLPQLLPAMVVVGGFVLHLFWEGKAQYILQYYFLCLPYAAAGLTALGERVAALPVWWRGRRERAEPVQKADSDAASKMAKKSC